MPGQQLNVYPPIVTTPGAAEILLNPQLVPIQVSGVQCTPPETTPTTPAASQAVFAGNLGSTGAATWGSITGVLTNQVDLYTYLLTLVTKATTVNGHALTGNVAVTPSDLGLVIGTNVEAWSPQLDIFAANGSAYYLNASNLNAGTVATARLPLATTSAAGTVRPDGSTITISGGTISAVQPPTATTSVLGLVKPDGTTITISNGVLSAAASGNVTISGTPTANQLAVWNSATAIKGVSTLTSGYLPANVVYTGTAFTGNLLMNNGSWLGVNGSDPNWRIGLNLGAFNTSTISTSTSAVVIGAGQTDGWAVGQTGGNSILELKGSNGYAWFRSNVTMAAAVTLSSYTTNGFVKFTGGTGTLAVDTNTYLTGITSSQVTTALGYTPPTPTGTGASGSWAINAATATTLATARAINGVNFDGSAAITVAAAAGTLTGTTLASGVVTSSLTSAAGGAFGTGAYAAAYTLPTASTSVLGGVKVDGTTITVNGSGVISSAGSSIGNSLAFTGGSSLTDDGTGNLTVATPASKTLTLNAPTVAIPLNTGVTLQKPTNSTGVIQLPSCYAVPYATYPVLTYAEGGGLYFGNDYYNGSVLIQTAGGAASAIEWGYGEIKIGCTGVNYPDIRITYGSIYINNGAYFGANALPQNAGGSNLGSAAAYWGSLYGQTLYITSGTNAKAGTFTLVSGAATVSNTSVTANSVIYYSPQPGGTSGTIGNIHTASVTVGTGFTVSGANTDNSAYNYVILEKN